MGCRCETDLFLFLFWHHSKTTTTLSWIKVEGMIFRYCTINNFFFNTNHWTILDPPLRNDPIFFGRRFLKVCPLNKGYSNPFARPSYLQPKLPPVGQAQGKLRRFRGVSVNFVGFEERMEYPLGNDHISPPIQRHFSKSMIFRLQWWETCTVCDGFSGGYRIWPW